MSAAAFLTIIQGSHHVARAQDVVLTTLLGSCVAACLWDDAARVGGMNHFLLPDASPRAAPDGSAAPPGGDGFSRGVHAMELLINDLLKAGARRRCLNAKLFGGASINSGLTRVGELNAAFAERFLRHEDIPVVGGSLRGHQGRRLQFWPMSGRVRQSFMDHVAPAAPGPSRLAILPAPSGELELF